MFRSNCCFFTYIQISQKTSKVIWYSHLFKSFPQFAVIHTVKGFSTVNEAIYIYLLLFGNLHSVGYIFSFLLCLSLLFFLKLFVRAPQTNTLPSCISFSWEWFWSLLPVQGYELPSIVLQARCLPDLIPWICSSPPLCNHKGFDLGHTQMAFFNLSLNFAKGWIAIVMNWMAWMKRCEAWDLAQAPGNRWR